MRNKLALGTGLALALVAAPLAAQDAAPAPETGTPTMMGTETMPLRGQSYSHGGEAVAGALAGGFTAQDLIGTSVLDAEGKTVGSISDLMVGDGNEVGHAVIDVGGFLGIGSKPVAVELEQIRRSADGDQLVVAMSRETIEALPEVRQENGWFTTGG
mgnify:CR=1 FL=1